MADNARTKLEAALANAKARQTQGPTSTPAPNPPPRSASDQSTSAPAPKKSKPKKKKPKKKKPPKKKGPGLGNALSKKFSGFASNLVDEFKTATSEISPGALIASANDSLRSIKKAVGIDETETASEDEAKSTPDAESSAKGQAPADIERAKSALSMEVDKHTAIPPVGQEDSEPKKMTSPAKVIKMPSKNKKADSAEETVADTNAASDADLPADTPKAPDPEADPESPGDDQAATGKTSPAKVQQAISKKPEENSEEASEDAALASESEETSTQEETTSESTGKTESQEDSQDKAPSKPKPLVSKTEHAVRSFCALQAVLTNPVWGPVVLDIGAKTSSLFAPREHFDTQFSDPIFRDGLKSAIRLATTYAFETEKMRFNEKIIERVTALELDPKGNIKTHTENLTSVLDEQIVEKVLDLLDNGHVKHLLFSVGTRLGTFVPTIESLARIYLTLRKKAELSSGDRLQIQEEIMMRYRKARYSEDMGKRARNLALNYFMDYLAEITIKLYDDRFKNVPKGQDNVESHHRRYNTIIRFCDSTIEEWAKKVAISTQAIESIQTKFHGMASDHFEEMIGEPPQPLEA